MRGALGAYEMKTAVNARRRHAWYACPLDGAAAAPVSPSGHDSAAPRARAALPKARAEAPRGIGQTYRVPDDLRVNSWLVIPGGELRERFSRSSGPGGQSVNTTDSRVELSLDIGRSPSLPERERNRALSRLAARLADGVVTVAAETERSQLMNREAARARLAALLRAAVAPPPPPRVPTKPTRGARERRLADKRRRAQTKRNRRPDPGDQ